MDIEREEAGMSRVSLHIKREGIRSDEFRGSVDAFTKMLDSLAEDASPGMTWMISVERGSLSINADLVSDGTAEDVAPAFRVISGGLSALGSGAPPATVPHSVRREYLKLVKAVGVGGDGDPIADIIASGDGTGDIVIPVRDHMAKPGPAGYSAVGSVTGRVYMLNSRRGNQFGIIDDLSGKAIKGTFGSQLLEKFKGVYNGRATVSGTISYDASGDPRSIEARSVGRERSTLPSLLSLRGILEARG